LLSQLRDLNDGKEIRAELHAETDGSFALDMSHQEALVNVEPLKGLQLTRLNLSECANLKSLKGLEGIPLTELNLTDCYALQGDLSALKGMIARMIEMLTFTLDMPVKSLGSTMFRRKDRAKGLEPDECNYFRNEAKMRGRKRLDLKKDPPPELVVEIDITHRSVPCEGAIIPVGK
jgi:hypothetical protein